METSGGMLRELRVVAKRGYDVLHLISRERKFALGGATLLMVATSSGNTAVALLLGWLIDRIQSGLQQEMPPATLYASAFRVLGAISAIYLIAK